MSKSKPYQPLVLRLLHGINALVALLAIVTSFCVYNIHDGRFGKISLPVIPDIVGIHGTFGLILFLFFPFFAVYSFYFGKKRLIQPDSLQKLTQIGKPIWWYSLHRITNTAMLLAVALGVLSGKMVQEEWISNQDFNHVWYNLHLISWVIIVLSLSMHLLMSAKVGGMPLLLSMFDIKYRQEDSPATWMAKIKAFFGSR